MLTRRLPVSSGVVPAANTKLLLRQSVSATGRVAAGRHEQLAYRLLLCTKWASPAPPPGLLSDVKVLKISTGAKHALLITDRRKLYAWGDGSLGRLVGLGFLFFFCSCLAFIFRISS